MERIRKSKWSKVAGIVLIGLALAGCESAAGTDTRAAEESRTAAASEAPVGAGPGPAVPAARLDAAVRGQVAEALAQALAEQYVYEEIGLKMAGAIRDKLKEGAYDKIGSPVEFADALQADLRAISRDGHLGVRYEPMAQSAVPEGPEPGPVPEGPGGPVPWAEPGRPAPRDAEPGRPAPRVTVRDEPGPAAPLPQDAGPMAPGLIAPAPDAAAPNAPEPITPAPNAPGPNGPAPRAPLAPAPRVAGPDAAMLPDVRILDGNIGYMAVNAMPPSESAQQAIAAAFALLGRTDALILDLRGNTGGSPAIVGLIEGYLSEGPPRTTNTVHWRNDDRPERLRTAYVGELSYGSQKPVYVLTSQATFSAAEQLSYDLQAFGRAAIVGETTGGGSHTSNIGPVPLGHGFVANIPTGYLVNAVTGTNWEGTGVQPDVAVPAEEALAAAWSLAARTLAESAADPAARAWLDLFAGAKLSGDPDLEAAALAGEYAPVPGGGPGMPATIRVEDGALRIRMRAGSGVRDAALAHAGGNRYAPEGYPSGFSCVFVRQQDGIRLLVSEAGRLTVLGK
jgi:hypothetical protein